MLNFWMLVLAIVVAQVCFCVIVLTIMLNKSVLKWYTKKTLSIVDKVTEEIVEESL